MIFPLEHMYIKHVLCVTAEGVLKFGICTTVGRASD